ncbi:MAG: hypothetical protein D6761_06830 [Candidatus Dadabacteria bacterium]|nr:MAG: hypothetical protein D6761_06830 [Candidatus Dadabacteria bacterium]
MEERRRNPEAELNKVDLRPLLARDFPTSEAFIDDLGLSVTEKGMFIPMRVSDRFQVGGELQLRFTLDGRKEILAGTARIVFIRDGANGEKPGCGVKFLELTERSRKNLAMIIQWREERQQRGAV